MEAILAAVEELAHVGGWAFDLGTHDWRWTDELFRIHGLDPAQAAPTVAGMLERIHPLDRARVAELLDDVVERPETIPDDGVTAEYRALRPDGSVRDVRFLGRIAERGAGGPGVWLGSAQDVTEQRITERELRIHYALAQTMREWESMDEGIVVLLRRLGTALEFPLGALFVWDEAREDLFCWAFWSSPGVDGAAFEALARSLRFRPGEGAPGRAWSEGRPVLVPDLPATPWIRRREAASLGLQSGIAVPALGEDGPIAALAFYSHAPNEPSARIAGALASVGAEVGRFLSRHRALLAPRTLSERELEVLALAAEGCSGPEIAERLVVSPSTVKSHFENIYEKLGVGDRAAAVARALRTGLIR